jgi:SpoVK/Ycf46/Vps4 family AAA+-type ATPase
MDLNNVAEENLKKRYQEQLQEAQNERENENPDEAARLFAKAAKTLDALDDIQSKDRSDEIERLKELVRDLSGNGNDSGPSPQAPEADEESGFDTETFLTQTDVSWDQIGGLDSVKSELKRAITLGGVQEKPDAVQPTDRLLLFGPPGTGKTMLASAVAGSVDADFYDVKLGDLISKYFGDTPKQIKGLFQSAKQASPSVIFLDEIDALTQSREGDMDDHSRRALNALLSELDGTTKNDDDFVMVLGATNTPWDLDFAIRRRFSRRILVPLPDVNASEAIVRENTEGGGVPLEGQASEFLIDGLSTRPATPYEAVAESCIERGYSGSDIADLCNAAINEMVRRQNTGLEAIADQGMEEIREYTLDTGPVTPADFRTAFEATSASLSNENIDQFHDWADEYGSRPESL